MSTYLTRESINDYESTALKYYYFSWILIVIASLIGFVNNILILMVMKRRKNLNSFDIFLIVLAGFDAFSSFTTILTSTFCVAYFGNWFGRGWFIMYWYSLSIFSAFYGRTGSTFTTVLITIERFLIITFPYKANSWITLRTTKVLAFIGFLIASLLNVPRFFGYSVEYNEYQDIASIQGMEWVLKATNLGKYSCTTLHGLHYQVDALVPLPIIALFNLLSYWKVHKLSNKRKEITANVKRDIRTIKMFLPVVMVYIITNVGPVANQFIVEFGRIAIGEMFQVLFLSIALNSTANFPIYYWTSSAFKREFQELIGTKFPSWINFNTNTNNSKTSRALSTSSNSYK